jgi:hypothetical protein
MLALFYTIPHNRMFLDPLGIQLSRSQRRHILTMGTCHTQIQNSGCPEHSYSRGWGLV